MGHCPSSSAGTGGPCGRDICIAVDVLYGGVSFIITDFASLDFLLLWKIPSSTRSNQPGSSGRPRVRDPRESINRCRHWDVLVPAHAYCFSDGNSLAPVLEKLIVTLTIFRELAYFEGVFHGPSRKLVCNCKGRMIPSRRSLELCLPETISNG